MQAAALDLTPRQLEVLELLADGLRYCEVAERLSISARQVQRHAAQAVERTGAVNLYHLAAMAVDGGVI